MKNIDGRFTINVADDDGDENGGGFLPGFLKFILAAACVALVWSILRERRIELPHERISVIQRPMADAPRIMIDTVYVRVDSSAKRIVPDERFRPEWKHERSPHDYRYWQ